MRHETIRPGHTQAITNVRAALHILETQPSDPSTALWRLVDAAGLLADVLAPDLAGASSGYPTGRGYWIGGCHPTR